MVPRLSGQTSIFGVFFVSKFLSEIEGQKKHDKFAILTRTPRGRARILIHRTWPFLKTHQMFTNVIHPHLKTKHLPVIFREITWLSWCYHFWFSIFFSFTLERKAQFGVFFSSSGLWWFLSIALRICTAHDFRVISAHMSACVYQTVRDFPKSKVESEINAPKL